jgi:very-short-patch-repair endonuclease
MAGRYELFGRCIDRCESFIERRLAIALLFSEEFSFEPSDEGSGAIAEDRHGVILGQQVNVGGYRLDFALKRRHSDIRIAIEADGHQFHDGSPERAEHDRMRDRVLLAMGWRTVRFTGRELVRDPLGCARQTHELILTVSGGVRLPLAKGVSVPSAQLALRTTG